MGVADELRKTNKGQLQYSRELNTELVQRLTEEVSAPPKLYIYHQESPTYRSEDKVVKSLQASPEEKSDRSKDDKTDGTPNMPKIPNTKQLDGKGDNSKKEPVTSHSTVYRSPPVSPEYGRTSLEIRNYEVLWDNKAKSSVEAKLKEFADKDRELKTMVEQKANALEVKQQQEMKRLFEQTSKLQLKEKTETSKRIQQMRDSHRTRKKLQEDMLLEGERKKQQLQEEERKRNEMEKHQAHITQYYMKIKETHDKLMSEYDNCKCKDRIPEAGHKPRQISGQILAKAEGMTKKSEVSLEDVQTMKSLLEYAKNMFDFMHSHIEEVTNMVKAEETEKAKQLQLQQQQQQQQQQLQEQQKAAAEKAAASTQQTSQGETTPGAIGGRRLSVIDEVVTEYEGYKAKLDNIQKLLAPFMANTDRKKYRFELQKAVNTPINAISPVDGAHLRDKLQKLIHLLGGHQIEGKHVSAKDTPEGIPFCKNLIARMIVKKGEEQVSSKHESAFAIAMVAAGLWFEHNDLGELMLAHFHSFCPYILPLYFPKDNNMSSQQYHKLLGYKVEDDGSIEPQDKFLKRMSGIMRLYAAILVSSPPRANCAHPHGIEHAWVWLARVLNMDPYPDVSATLTYDMLQVTGHALYSVYKVQFVKLLFVLYKEFMPKLRQVSVAGGPVARLEQYLEQTLKNFKMKQMMSPPEGYLPQNFWFT